MHFVQDHDSPFLGREPFHESFRFPTAPLSVGDHAVSRDANARIVRLVFGVGCEATNLTVIRGAPHFELQKGGGR